MSLQVIPLLCSEPSDCFLDTWNKDLTVAFRGHLSVSGDIYGSQDLVAGVLQASGGQGPRVLLNILQCTGYHPKTKNYPTHDVSSAEVRTLALGRA